MVFLSQVTAYLVGQRWGETRHLGMALCISLIYQLGNQGSWESKVLVKTGHGMSMQVYLSCLHEIQLCALSLHTGDDR